MSRFNVRLIFRFFILLDELHGQYNETVNLRREPNSLKNGPEREAVWQGVFMPNKYVIGATFQYSFNKLSPLKFNRCIQKLVVKMGRLTKTEAIKK